MTIAKIKGQQTTAIQGASEGADVFLRGLRDGSLITADWRQAAVFGGFGYHFNVGAFSTGIVGGGAGTVIDVDTPDMVLSIPNGTCIMPMRIVVNVQMGAPADAQEQEILIALDADTEWDGTAGHTASTIYNMNTLSQRGSACTAAGAFTTTITTAPAVTIEIARMVCEYSVATAGEEPQILELVYEPKTMMVIPGPAMLLGYHGGDAANIGGYFDVQFLEFPEGTFDV